MLGAVAFYGVNWLGAVLCAVCAAIFGWLAYALWQLRPAAWVYTWLFAGVALLVAALAVLGASTLSAMLPTLIVNGVILAYCVHAGRQARLRALTVRAPTGAPTPRSETSA